MILLVGRNATLPENKDREVLPDLVVSNEVAEKVEKLREIGEATKKWTTTQKMDSQAAAQRTICVTPLAVDKDRLRDIFSGLGSVMAVWADAAKDTGYVQFCTADEAAKALECVLISLPPALLGCSVFLRTNEMENDWQAQSWEQPEAPKSVFQKPP